MCFFFVVIQIIDEADRMIDSMHQLWLSQVVKAVYRSGSGPEATSIFKRAEPTHITAARYGTKLRLPEEEHNRWEEVETSSQATTKNLILTPLIHLFVTHYIMQLQGSSVLSLSLSPPQMPLQKLLFSATLTQNPEKLQQLGLHQPRLFSSIHGSAATTPTLKQDRFDFPQGLTVRADRQPSGRKMGLLEVWRLHQQLCLFVFRSITSRAR